MTYMKVIDLFRHSTKKSAGNVDISEAGIVLAREFAAKTLRAQNYTHLYTSPLKRTAQTMDAFRDGAGDLPNTPYEIFPLHEILASPEGLRLAHGVCHDAETAGRDMMEAAILQEPDATRYISSEASAAFHTWLSELPQDTHALVIHHSPSIEFLVYGLFGNVLKQLHYCEGVRIIGNEGSLSYTELRR